MSRNYQIFSGLLSVKAYERGGEEEFADVD